MRLVERPALYPSHCVVLPYVGASKSTRWIDAQVELPPSNPNREQHVYVSDHAVREMARLMGYVPAVEVRAAELKTQALETRIQELETDLREANRFLDAIDVLESRDFTTRKRPGRPRKEVEA